MATSMRTHLSRPGFSKEDRDTNILRIGFVASEIVRHGGVAVCRGQPLIAARNEVRQMFGDDRFIEIFVDTPLNVCEDAILKVCTHVRRSGEISGFTGIDDPYEKPENAEDRRFRRSIGRSTITSRRSSITLFQKDRVTGRAT